MEHKDERVVEKLEKEVNNKCDHLDKMLREFTVE